MKKNNIKNIITLTAICCAGIMVSSCKKYLEPASISSFNTDYVYSNVGNAQKAVLGAYQNLTGDNGYGIRLSMYFPYDNDEMIGMHQLGDNDRGDIAHFNATSGNGQINNPWNQLWQGIERANQSIYYIPLMDMYKSGTTSQKAELQRLYGEALTLRAQYYFEIIRNWGDVPAQWQPSAFESNLFKAKTDRDTLYNHLLADLKVAEDIVPWRNDVVALGDQIDERITKGAVKGLRARIALFRGGYSLRAASSSYGQKMARPADYKTYYQIAKDECNDIMQQRSQHTLNPSFQSVFKDYLDAHNANDPYGEIMFSVAMAGGSGTFDSKLGYYDGPKVNGLGNAALGILPTYFYLFDSTDKRRDVTCVPYEVTADLNTLKGHTLTTVVDGKFRRDWMSNPSQMTNSAQYFGVNWPILRFSDILLMFAEADNELNNGPTAAATAAFEEVRKRGFGNASIGITPSDYNGFFQAIVRERSLEFGGEGIRKYDLIRWNLLAQRIDETKLNLTNMANKTGTYVGVIGNNTDFSQLPDSAFYKSSSTIATGIIWGTSLYKPRTISSLSGFKMVGWATSAVANVLSSSGSSNGYAYYFKANHSELLPIPQPALDANYNLKQDYGY